MRAAVAWADHRRAYVGIALLAVGLALSTAGGPWPWISVASPLLIAAVAGIAPRPALLAAAALIAGVAIGSARVQAIDTPGDRLRDGAEVAGRAHLLEPPRPGPFGLSAELRLLSGDAAGVRLLGRVPHELGGRLAGVEIGGEVEVEGALRRAPESRGEGFDFGAHLRRQGIAGELHVDWIAPTSRRRGGLAGAVDAIRARSSEAIAAGLPPDAGALALGMVLGADERLPHGVREDFRDAGLAHVLAVSGQNVALLCLLALPLLTAIGLPHAARGPALLALIALYVPLAGAGPSIQRAGVMGAASLLAVALARPASRAYALGLAACVTLALNPRTWSDPGWQLSFAAVAGILALAPGIAGALRPLPRLLADGIALTVAATVATAPLLAHHFGAVSVAGIAANVAALPLVAPIMWLGMVRAALGQAMTGGGTLDRAATPLNDAVGALLGVLVRCLRDLAERFADAPGAHVAVDLGAPVEVASAYAAIGVAVAGARVAARRFDTSASTAVAYVRRLPRSRRLALAALAVAFAVLAAARGLAPPGAPSELTVSFLDVGQGDATLIQHPSGAAVLFDGGPPEGGVVRLLRRAGVERLSLLVMTHASRDHHGGLAEVVGRLPVDVLLDGGDGSRDPSFRSVVAAAERHGTRVVPATAPLALDVGPLRVDVLAPRPRPPGPPPDDPNPRAVVATVSAGGFDLLLSGDAESEVLLPLSLPDVEAIKVAHHGSADPGLPELLERVRPEAAAIPVGPNDYGHPAPSTIAALRRAGVATWRNDRNGTVRLVVDPRGVRVEAERGGPVSGGP